MTREEAITYANCLKNNYTINFDDMADFCDMAIKALEQEPCEDIKEYYKDIWDCDINHPLYEDTVAEIVKRSYISGYVHGVENTAKEIRFGLEQDTKMQNGCTDVKTTNKDQLLNGFVEMMKAFWSNQDLKAPNLETLNQEPCGPCDDCISRKAVEKITWEEPSYTDALNVLTEVREKVRALPPINSQPKIGHWILADEQNKEDVENDNYRFICSECQCSDIHAKGTKVPYCWKCGTRMAESEEEECGK